MTKQEFLTQLREKMSGMPQEDIDERTAFYGEMLDDRIEDGLSEEEAVNEIGNVDDIVSQILADTPLTKIVKEKLKTKNRLKAWQIVLLAVGSPIWASLLIAAIAVIFSLWVSLWAVIISLWAVDVSFAATAVAGVIEGVIFIVRGNLLSGIFAIGAGLACAGLFIFLLFVCKALTKYFALLTKKIVISIKKMFVGKEDVK